MNILKLKLPTNVQICIRNHKIIVQGALGVNYLNLRSLKNKNTLLFKIRTDKILIKDLSNKPTKLGQRKKKNKNTRIIKTIFSLLRQKVTGASRGFIKNLEIIGVGYRVSLSNEGQCQSTQSTFSEIPSNKTNFVQKLNFKLGFTNEIQCTLPKGIFAFVSKNDIRFFSTDLHKLTQVCACLKQLKKPDSYKGKGIRYKNEVLKLKIGKKK